MLSKLINRFKIRTYNVGFITKKLDMLIMNGISKGDIKWLKHSYKDRFFADPFLWYEDSSNYYLLAEEYLFYQKKGKISLLTVSKSTYKLIERKVIIEEQYHLSFPFCNPNSEKIIAESHQSGKCIEYTIDKKTHKIKKTITLINKPLIDPVQFKINGNEWLLASHVNNPKEEIFLYKKVDNQYVILKQEPIKKDISTSRNAGRIINFNNKMIRPVQDCLKTYGHQIKLMQIEKILENDYQEIEIATLNNHVCSKYNETMHTFNVYDDIIIVDGSKDLVRFPMKIIYKIIEKNTKKRVVNRYE